VDRCTRSFELHVSKFEHGTIYIRKSQDLMSAVLTGWGNLCSPSLHAHISLTHLGTPTRITVLGGRMGIYPGRWDWEWLDGRWCWTPFRIFGASLSAVCVRAHHKLTPSSWSAVGWRSGQLGTAHGGAGRSQCTRRSKPAVGPRPLQPPRPPQPLSMATVNGQCQWSMVTVNGHCVPVPCACVWREQNGYQDRLM
jgi:hypothetical protein